MLNIVIPMAGAGSRFSKAGYKEPKPLILVNGYPMISVVIANLRPNRAHRFIFICQSKDIQEYNLDQKLQKWSPESLVIGIDGLTEGAACTVLRAREYINNSDELMIANCDQYIDVSINEYLDFMGKQDLDGLIMTMQAKDPKWSFVGLNEEKFVTSVIEKQVISDEATVGIYNFRKGSDFVFAADQLIEKNIRTNNEFYVAPVYNELINDGYKVGVFNIGKEADGMYGLGTPADLNLFHSLSISKNIGHQL